MEKIEIEKLIIEAISKEDMTTTSVLDKRISEAIKKDKEKISKLIDERIFSAIEERKKSVSKQFKIWGASISAIFSFMLIIGFTGDDIKQKIRTTILPTSHIVTQLTSPGLQSEELKNSIISELNDPSFVKYPETKESLQKNVWETLQTDNEDMLISFISKTKLDEVIIDSHYQRVSEILFSDKPSNIKAQKEMILKIGGEPYPISIGEFKNRSKSKTNCGIEFKQDAKRVIMHIAAPENGAERKKVPMPWFQCPRGYHDLEVSLKIEEVEISGVRVVGVERPTESTGLKGNRARVTHAVSEEFRKRGVDLGTGLSQGSIKVTRVYRDL
ncbi:MAG: hypothetical protein KTR20_15090 [Cellvibrionaceae bacterium]|nr:hypothetical protein [Cellvibrionaceae bacterium]